MKSVRQPPSTVGRLRFTNNGPAGVVMSTLSSLALLMLLREVASGNGLQLCKGCLAYELLPAQICQQEWKQERK